MISLQQYLKTETQNIEFEKLIKYILKLTNRSYTTTLRKGKSPIYPLKFPATCILQYFLKFKSVGILLHNS